MTQNCHALYGRQNPPLTRRHSKSIKPKEGELGGLLHQLPSIITIDPEDPDESSVSVISWNTNEEIPEAKTLLKLQNEKKLLDLKASNKSSLENGTRRKRREDGRTKQSSRASMSTRENRGRSPAQRVSSRQDKNTKNEKIRSRPKRSKSESRRAQELRKVSDDTKRVQRSSIKEKNEASVIKKKTTQDIQRIQRRPKKDRSSRSKDTTRQRINNSKNTKLHFDHKNGVTVDETEKFNDFKTVMSQLRQRHLLRRSNSDSSIFSSLSITKKKHHRNKNCNDPFFQSSIAQSTTDTATTTNLPHRRPISRSNSEGSIFGNKELNYFRFNCNKTNTRSDEQFVTSTNNLSNNAARELRSRPEQQGAEISETKNYKPKSKCSYSRSDSEKSLSIDDLVLIKDTPDLTSNSISKHSLSASKTQGDESDKADSPQNCSVRSSSMHSNFSRSKSERGIFRRTSSEMKRQISVPRNISNILENRNNNAISTRPISQFRITKSIAPKSKIVYRQGSIKHLMNPLSSTNKLSRSSSGGVIKSTRLYSSMTEFEDDIDGTKKIVPDKKALRRQRSVPNLVKSVSGSANNVVPKIKFSIKRNQSYSQLTSVCDQDQNLQA